MHVQTGICIALVLEVDARISSYFAETCNEPVSVHASPCVFHMLDIHAVAQTCVHMAIQFTNSGS